MVDVKITKQNEVYLRIDCDMGILYELESIFTFDVPGAKFSPKFKMKVWDGKIRLLSAYKRQLYVGLHDRLCKELTSLGYTYETNVGDDSQITPAEVVDFVKELNMHTQGKPIEFRDYQYNAVHAALKYRRRTILSPTASGKSAIIYAITRYLLSLHMRVLIIVPTTQLVYQMVGDFKDYSSENGWDAENGCHIIMSGRTKISDSAVFIATWQSLQRDKVSDAWVNQFDCIMVDECFSGETKVLTINGWVALKHITKGEKLLNINSKNEIKVDTVTEVHKNLLVSRNEKMYRLKFDNGIELQVTGNHKLMLDDGSWKRADQITEQDEIKWVGAEIKDHKQNMTE